MQRHRHIKKSTRSHRRRARKEPEEQGDINTLKRKRNEEDEYHKMPTNRQKPGSPVSMDIVPSQTSNIIPDPPQILSHVNFGLNEACRMLERHISSIRESLLHSRPLDQEIVVPRIIMACRFDVNPPDLFSHIPHLVASANTLATLYSGKFPSKPSPLLEIKLINLPKGAEDSLSEAVGIRRLSMVTLDVRFIRPLKSILTNQQSKTPLGYRLEKLIDKVPRLATPWLIPTTNPKILVPTLQPTHIKHVKTTAPVDQRAAKQERANSRKAAKKAKKEKRCQTNLDSDSAAKYTVSIAKDTGRTQGEQAKEVQMQVVS